MSNIKEFNNIVMELIELLNNLITIEETKLNAVSENNLSKLDKCITEEQAYIMQLRGLDKKREQIQSSLGFENLTFSEIISNLPDIHKDECKDMYDQLLNKTNDFKSISSSVKTAIEVNLHSIDSIINKLKNDSKGSKKISTSNTSFTTRFV